MIRKFKQWRERRILEQSPYTQTDWQQVLTTLPVLNQLDGAQRKKLFKLATLFLHQKEITGAQGFEVTDMVRQSIALQACLPILNLDLQWYQGWTSVIVYPAAFRRQSTEIDEFGVSHIKEHNLAGEAWLRGPVILSWTDTEHAGIRDGQNVVIHEFVHKLDMLNGRANGFPPMQKGMDPTAWSNVMSSAYADFQVNPKPGLDRYGATNPAEFFTVLSEVFFETPHLLFEAYPQVYQLMAQFYVQSPLGSAVEQKPVTPREL